MRALALLVAATALPRTTALIVYYNVFSKNVATAVEIVYEQLTELRAAPIWASVEEVRYSTIGKGKMRNHVERICRELNMRRSTSNTVYGTPEATNATIRRSWASGKRCMEKCPPSRHCSCGSTGRCITCPRRRVSSLNVELMHFHTLSFCELLETNPE